MNWARAALCAALVYFGAVSGGMTVLHLFFAGAMLWRGEKGILELLLLPVLGVAALSGFGLSLAWRAFARRSASAFLIGLPLWLLFNIEALLLALWNDKPLFWAEEETTTPVAGMVLLFLGAGWLLLLLGGVVLSRLPEGEPGKAEPSRD